MDAQLTGYDASKSDYNCQDGEVEKAIGYISRPDGCLTSDISAKTAYTMPDGFTQMCRHNTYDSDNIIAVSNHNDRVKLWWATYTEDKDVYDTNDFTQILTTGRILCHTSTRESLTVSTNQGVINATWDGAGYDLSGATHIIDIEFGLRKAGVLTTGDTVEVSSEMVQTSSGNGSGAYRPHPTDNATIQNREKVSTVIAKIYSETVRTMVTDHGYVNQPILIRYALRTSTGAHILPSPPILLLPTVLPPRISVSTVTPNNADKAYLQIDLTGCNYHELCYRIPHKDLTLDSDIVAVDIYATKPFDTYDSSRLTEGFVTSYTDVTSTSSTNRPRGRRSPESTNTVFDGHYAIDGNSFADQYIDPTTMTGNVWMMFANNRLVEQICNASQMHLIASIPAAEITASDTFVSIPVYYGDGQPVTLDHTPVYQSAIVANALCAINGQLAAAVGQRILPSPHSPRNTYTGNASMNTAAQLTVAVTINDKGRRFSLSATKPGYTDTLSRSIPRYLYYPDRRAEQMTIRQASESVTVTLTPHPTMDGAYWMGGLGQDIDNMATDEPTEIPTDDRINTPGLIMMTVKGDNWVYDTESSITLSCDSIVGLGIANRTDLYSTIGRYPMYAFTTNGVWIIEHSAGTGRIVSAQLLTNHPCRRQAAIASMEDAYAFVSDRNIYTVSQHKIAEIPPPWTLRPFDIIGLPHLDEVLRRCQIPQHGISAANDNIDNYNIEYDCNRQLLIAYDPAMRHCYAYSLSTRLWSMLDIGVGYAQKADSGTLHVCNENTVGVLCDEPHVHEGLIVTRPIRISKNIEPHDITMAEVLGAIEDDHAWLLLYESNDMLHWHLVQAARRRWLDDLNHTTYRYHRYVIISRMSAGEYIYGISCRQA